MRAPVEAEPAHVRLDGVDIELLLLERVGVVEAQMAAPAELRRDAEIQADRLGVADMEIAVGLGRETGDDAAFPAARQVGADDVANEVARGILCRGLCRSLCQGWRIGVGHGGSGSGRTVGPEDRCQKPRRRGSGHIARVADIAISARRKAADLPATPGDITGPPNIAYRTGGRPKRPGRGGTGIPRSYHPAPARR